MDAGRRQLPSGVMSLIGSQTGQKATAVLLLLLLECDAPLIVDQTEDEKPASTSTESTVLPPQALQNPWS
ncbi:hypothetical protein I6F35_37265 [Bradyrhizobium sp. BRP22]|uniref:hypothetical protein n=1 Tax=Bradyrhizobium sp. BRP22 TaxID=2793821 RepID=UPI001CD2877C|nr:hypothetical protein [Bradyrhizobium sp. BRP22]MCA1458755.1 hypothetical protein [Bradyrhizobium sp. BRP22]